MLIALHILDFLLSRKLGPEIHDKLLCKSRRNMHLLKIKTNSTFEDLEEIYLLSQRSHMLDRVEKNIERNFDLRFFDASLFEHFNFIIKKCPRMKSMQDASTFEEIFYMSNSSNNKAKSALDSEVEVQSAGLSRDGVQLPLQSLRSKYL